MLVWKCGRDNVWDGFTFIYLLIVFNSYWWTLWDEVWQARVFDLKITVVVQSKSSPSLRHYIKGLSHSFNKTLGANMDVALTLLVTSDDIVHTEQIRGVWNGNENKFFLKYIFVLCKDIMMGVSFDFDIRHYWWWVHIWFVYKTCIFFFPFYATSTSVTFEQWFLLEWYFQKSVVLICLYGF